MRLPIKYEEQEKGQEKFKEQAGKEKPACDMKNEQ